MTSETENIDALIGKVLSGEASLVENEVLENWRNAHADNNQYYVQTKLVFDAALHSSSSLFNTDAAWQNVLPHLSNSQATTTPVESIRKFRIEFKLYHLAAIFVALIGIGAVLFSVFSESKSQKFSMESFGVVMKDTLPDGTMATLAPLSVLEYNFDKKENKRIAHLDGEAFFNVKHNENAAFIIETQDVYIEDIGTTFNVKSLPSQDTVLVYVKEGEVRFFSNSDNGISIRAGEYGGYVKSTKTFFQTAQIEGARGEYATLEFNFQNATLRTVIKQINGAYFRHIQLTNQELNNCRITVNFNQDNIETIAAVIAETMGWNVTDNGDFIMLNGLSCE